ncbi:MAG: hypothetical protein VYE22_17495 [Myxococcota bacterium]|nr:hypothetical protein [Myxococcota bacterium]
MHRALLLILALTACSPSDPPAAPDASRPVLDASEAADAAASMDAGERTRDAGLDAGSLDCDPTEGPQVVAVAGPLEHGARLVVTGCGFGDRDAPGPRLYDRVDDQPAYAGAAVGDLVPVGDDAPWSRRSDNWATTPRLADDRPRGHRARFYRVAGGGNGGDGYLGWPRALGGTRPPPDQLRLYVSWWYRPSMDPGGGDPEGANKFIRVWDNDGAERTYVSWTHMHIGYSGGERTGWRSWTRDGRIGEWNRMEILVDAEAGTVRHYVNGVYQRVSHSAVGDFDIDDFEKDPAFAELGLNVAVLGFDHGLTSYPDMVTDFGEIWAHTSPARLEIGDAPTWSETRHREIQLPTSWEDGAIAVELDEGTFDTLGGRYLYVVDDRGRVNERGFPLESR